MRTPWPSVSLVTPFLPPLTARTRFVQAQKHEFFLVAVFRAFWLKRKH